MLENILYSISDKFTTVETFFICTITSIILGFIIACAHMFRNTYNKNFIVTLSLLPVVVQVIIMLINGNLGAGVAVAGAFSLVRFRSAQGSAKDIYSIFVTMAVGLGTGMGYIGISTILVLTVSALSVLYSLTDFGCGNANDRYLKIMIPENLQYPEVFNDLFSKYTVSHSLVKIKSYNSNNLCKLSYRIRLKKDVDEKEFIDGIRQKNDNLEIICSKIVMDSDTL